MFYSENRILYAEENMQAFVAGVSPPRAHVEEAYAHKKLPISTVCGTHQDN